MLNFIGPFLLGCAYALAAVAFIEAVHSSASVRHRWHRLPTFARAALVIVWPLPACWLFTDRGHG